MTLHFLCAKHRQQLTQNPESAQDHWQEWMDKGSRLYEERQYHHAIKFIGCAYELADHFLEQEWPDAQTAVSRFTYSSICLARACEQVDERSLRQQVLAQTEARLSDGVDTLKHYEHLARCKNSLKKRADSSYWINNQLLPSSHKPADQWAH